MSFILFPLILVFQVYLIIDRWYTVDLYFSDYWNYADELLCLEYKLQKQYTQWLSK